MNSEIFLSFLQFLETSTTAWLVILSCAACLTALTLTKIYLQITKKNQGDPTLYKKSILFNKKYIEFNIRFDIDDIDHIDPSNKWEKYKLSASSSHTLNPTEQAALHRYLRVEGYIEDAENFYKSTNQEPL
jgi:hypothetical protein